jgi:hypothetical protein
MAPPHTAARETREEHERRRIRLARLQADLAYFQARLGMIGTPRTANQAAQKLAFEALKQQLATPQGRAMLDAAIERRTLH